VFQYASSNGVVRFSAASSGPAVGSYTNELGVPADGTNPGEFEAAKSFKNGPRIPINNNNAPSMIKYILCKCMCKCMCVRE
jgi:hypothetical protein